MDCKFRRVVAATGGMLLAVVVLAACSESSTATAPVGDPAASVTTSTGASVPTSKSSQAPDTSDAVRAASDASKTLPATEPNSKTSTPKDFPGTSTTSKLSAKERKYVDALKRDGVTFKGDSDNSVSLTMGYYVCHEQEAKTDPTMVKAYVTAAVGPTFAGESNAQDRANVAAAKLITAAEKNLC